MFTGFYAVQAMAAAGLIAGQLREAATRCFLLRSLKTRDCLTGWAEGC